LLVRRRPGAAVVYAFACLVGVASAQARRLRSRLLEECEHLPARRRWSRPRRWSSRTSAATRAWPTCRGSVCRS